MNFFASSKAKSSSEAVFIENCMLPFIQLSHKKTARSMFSQWSQASQGINMQMTLDTNINDVPLRLVELDSLANILLCYL